MSGPATIAPARRLPRAAPRRHHPWLVVSSLALLGVLALAAFPARAWIDQRRQRDELAAQVGALTADIDRLGERVATLQADETVERLARERYHMVRPGEEAYAILPDGRAPGPLGSPPAAHAPAQAEPAPAPADGAEPGWLRRAWARISSLF